MSNHDPEALTERLLGDVDHIRTTVLEAVADRFPGLLRAVEADGPAAPVQVRSMVEALLAGVAGGSAGSAALDRRIRDQVGHHVRAAVAQQDVVDLYDYAMSLVIGQAWRRGRPGDHAELTVLTQRAARVVETVQRIIGDAYWVQARADRFGRHERRVLAHALLAGRATAEHAAAAGQPLAERYRAVVFRAADDAASWQPRVSEILHDRGVLHCVLAQEIVAFVPETDAGPLSVGRRLGVGPVGVGTSEPRSVSGLPIAVNAARLVACLALTVPLLDVVASDDQIRLELTLLNDETLADGMRELAAPIGARADLLQTIKVLYQLDLNRTSTARRLGIARRTLSGRLTRIHQLTGLDPTSTRGIQVLYTALTAMSMRDAVRAAPGA